ncbi:MAG: serine O-acetyltransferase [Acidimicrobiales bacterium]
MKRGHVVGVQAGSGPGSGAGPGEPAPGQPGGIRGDLDRLLSGRGTYGGRPSWRGALRRVVTRPGPLAIAMYRAGHWLWERGHELSAELVWRASLTLTGADIHPGADIGGGLKVVHTSGLTVARGTRIGRDVTLLHGVTLGGNGRGYRDPSYADGPPTIGDGCEIWAGAKVLGPVTVGAGCRVGANAVLVHDLAEGETFTAAGAVSRLEERVAALERRLAGLG